jgi:hypothetical protein
MQPTYPGVSDDCHALNFAPDIANSVLGLLFERVALLDLADGNRSGHNIIYSNVNHHLSEHERIRTINQCLFVWARAESGDRDNW